MHYTRCFFAKPLLALLLSLFAVYSPQAASAVTTRQMTDSQAIFQSVRDVEISPDGQWAIYTGFREEPNVRLLFSVPTAGGVATQLAERPVLISKITADSSRAVYVGDDDNPGQYDLFSIPIGGGVATQLSDVHIGGDGGILTTWDLSAEGSRVVYRARLSSDDPYELFSVSVTGGPSTRLNDDLVTGGEITSVALSHDGTRVVYRADQESDGKFEIFSVPLGGGIVTRLNSPLIAGRTVKRFTIGPDDASVLYIADQDSDDVFELYRVPLTGGSSSKLSGALVSGGNVTEALFAPDGGHVVYRADGDTDDMYELYAVPSLGGSVVKVSGPLVAGGDVEFNSSRISWLVDESSQWVAYLADQDTDHVTELYAGPLAGGQVNKLSPPMMNGSDVAAGLITHQGHVVFRANTEVGLFHGGPITELYHELYSSALSGGPAIKLNTPMMRRINSFSEIGDLFQVHSGEVFYIAPQETVVAEAYRVAITGGSPIRLNIPTAAVLSFQLSPDGSSFFYTGAVIPGRSHLFQRPTSSPGEHLQLSAPSSFVRGLTDQIEMSTPTGQIVFSGSQETLKSELFSLPLQGGQPLRLSDTMVVGGHLDSFVLSPDGTRLVYLADQDTAGSTELYSTSVTGGDVVKLSIPPADGGGALFRLTEPFTPDGQTVVYKAYQGPDPDCGLLYVKFELFSVASQGGAARTLYSPQGKCEDIFEFKIDSTGSFVVFTTFVYKEGTTKLFSVPVTGGTVVELNPLGRVSFFEDGFEITADGTRVVFEGRVEGDEEDQLYSVPIGGGEVVRLNDFLPAGGRLSDFGLSSDGQRAVYRASQVLFEQPHLLYSVSVEGGPTTELSGTMVDGGGVGRFAISSSFGRVIFSADRETDGVVELYSVSLAGGPVSKLSNELASGDQVDEFIISEDSEHVVYRVRRTQDDYPELYSAPLGGGPAVLLSHPLTVGESIDLFEINAQGSHVLYYVEQAAEDSGAFYRVPMAGGQAIRFSSSSIRISDQFLRPDEHWFSSDGSSLLYAGTLDGDFSEEVYLAEELDLFLDGFESGSTDQWSATVPELP